MSPGLKASVYYNTQLIATHHKTLNKPRMTHTGDHKGLKHTLNMTQSLRSKQKPSEHIHSSHRIWTHTLKLPNQL